MNIQEVLEKLKQKFSGQPFELVETKPDPYIKVPVDVLHSVMEFLKEELQFDTLSDLCGCDHIKEGLLTVVYHPFSYVHKTMLSLKVVLAREGTPSVESIADLYKAADWLERETYDMFGILFKNHPNLRRILMPEDWEGYPLRKDFVTPDYYNGMPVPLYFDDKAEKEGGHA